MPSIIIQMTIKIPISPDKTMRLNIKSIIGQSIIKPSFPIVLNFQKYFR